MELKRMGAGYDVSNIPFYTEIREKALSEGERNGERKGENRGRTEERRAVLLELLSAKFGQVPKWAETRIAKAPTRDLQRWTKGILTADSLQGLIGLKIPKD